MDYQLKHDIFNKVERESIQDGAEQLIGDRPSLQKYNVRRGGRTGLKQQAKERSAQEQPFPSQPSEDLRSRSVTGERGSEGSLATGQK